MKKNLQLKIDFKDYLLKKINLKENLDKNLDKLNRDLKKNKFIIK